MIWILLLILAALGVAAYLGGRTLARRRSVGAKPHSRPGQHGAYALIWVAAPALLVLVLGSVFSAPLLASCARRGSVAALDRRRRGALTAGHDRLRRPPHPLPDPA